MQTVFYEGRPDFPVDKDELDERLKKVERLIDPDQHVAFVNVRFVLAAGKLMEDCGLITEKNLRFLSNAAACRDFNPDFKFPFNPDEGAVRAVDHDGQIYGADYQPRFYHGERRRLELMNGQHYLFSNDWYPFNKRQFFFWLATNARMTCEKFWNRRPSHIAPPDGVKIVHKITDELKPADEPATVTADKPDELSKVIESLKILHSKVDNLTLELDELKKLCE